MDGGRGFAPADHGGHDQIGAGGAISAGEDTCTRGRAGLLIGDFDESPIVDFEVGCGFAEDGIRPNIKNYGVKSSP